MERLLRTLGSQKKSKDIHSKKNHWELDVLDNAFRFHVSDAEVEWFVEYHELEGVEETTQARPPWGTKRVLDLLEKLSPGYNHINITPELILIRKRLEFSPGLVVNSNGKQIDFYGDDSLIKFNFLDFYNNRLKSLIGQPVIPLPDIKEKYGAYSIS